MISRMIVLGLLMRLIVLVAFLGERNDWVYVGQSPFCQIFLQAFVKAPPPS